MTYSKAQQGCWDPVNSKMQVEKFEYFLFTSFKSSTQLYLIITVLKLAIETWEIAQKDGALS